MHEACSSFYQDLVHDLANADTELALFMLLLVAAAIVLDGIRMALKSKRKEIGMVQRHKTIAIDGTGSLPARNYVSEKQGLAGKPDALIVENGFVIPVEVKPFAKKIRDRYIAQILVYLRLIEEFEGHRPPYGYLILGANKRRVRIDNTPDRQAWLENMLISMRGILDGTARATPTPQFNKCSKCNVRDNCKFRADKPQATARPGILAQRA